MVITIVSRQKRGCSESQLNRAKEKQSYAIPALVWSFIAWNRYLQLLPHRLSLFESLVFSATGTAHISFTIFKNFNAFFGSSPRFFVRRDSDWVARSETSISPV